MQAARKPDSVLDDPSLSLIQWAEPGPPKSPMPDEQPIPQEPALATPEPAKALPSLESSKPLPYEEPPPMLDVHPAHHAASTWKDFFIHIATIVIGLLIAVSLEQGVEYIHHRRELAEARKQLATERKINVVRFAVETEELHRFVPILQNNLAIFVYLRQHPGKPLPPSLGVLRWNLLTVGMVDNAWANAQHSGAVDHMRQSEARNEAELYGHLSAISQQIRDVRAAHTECVRYKIVDPAPEHMSPDQLDHEIDLVSRELLAFGRIANVMRPAHTQFPEFAPAPSVEDYLAITHDTLTPSAVDKRDREATSREIETFRKFENSLDQNEGPE
jgi:hypothetical protein